jgi:hypothetical protein
MTELPQDPEIIQELSIRVWIEAEELADDVNDFCNIAVYLSTGHRYALNVWTFDFFATARADGELHASPEAKHLYMHPPDLFVQDLTRPTIEAAVVDILERGRLPAHCLMPDEAEPGQGQEQ